MDLEESDPAVRAAVLGRQVEAFLETEIAQYLLDRAQNEAEEALKALRTVNCTRSEDIRSLQNRVWVAESFQKWLEDAITEGMHALHDIEER